MAHAEEGIHPTVFKEEEQKAPHGGHSSRFSLLVIGTEADVFDPTSAAARRMEAYAQNFGEMHVVVLTARKVKKETRGDIHLYPAAAHSRLTRFIKAYFFVRSAPRTDIITAQDPFENGLLALFAARKNRAALHIQIHTDFLSPAFRSHTWQNRVRVFLARFVLARADAVRTVSSRILSALTEHRYRLKTTPSVLPIFVDVANFKTIVPDPTLIMRFSRFSKKLLVVSRLEGEKHVTLALNALRETPKDVCLIVLGEGSERRALSALAWRLGIAERVFFEGKRDVAPYYALADLVLVTSRYEGYGRVFIEAAAAGKPVLSTDVGIAKETGAIVASERDFAGALSAWLDHGPRSATMPDYPYRDFDDYVDRYCGDIIRSCEAPRKSP